MPNTTTRCEIRTSDGNARAAGVLGLSASVRFCCCSFVFRFVVCLLLFQSTKRVVREFFFPVCFFVCFATTLLCYINAEIPKPLFFYTQEAKDERKLKRAYRRHALRTHPDTGGASASTEAFQEVQKAYRTLRLELASPNNEVLTAEMSNDEEWEEHDWRWKVKYEKEKALDRNVTAKSQRKREEAFWT